MARSYRLLLPLFLFYSTAFAQKNEALTGGTLTLEYDANGKITNQPEGFLLTKNKDFDLSIKIKKPESQQTALWKTIANKCKATLKVLNDPESPVAMQFETLFSKEDLNELIKDLKELSAILSKNRLEVPDALKKSECKFTFFYGKEFLTSQLIGDIFTTHIGFDGEEESDTSRSVFKDYEINRKIQSANDSTVITVHIDNLWKQFVVTYYQKAINTEKLDTIKPRRFYSEVLPNPALQQLQKSFDSIYKEVEKIDTSDRIICNKFLVARYQELVAMYNQYISNNPLVNILRSTWMKNWFWFNEGVWKINPLNFTDEDLLPLMKGYDSTKATIFNNYIKSAVDLMQSSTTLNETKADYLHMDSLLRQIGNGRERFQYAAANALLIKTNKKEKKEASIVTYTANRLNLKFQDEDEVKNFRIRSYDAASQLKGSEENLSGKYALSNEIKVEAHIYNIKNGEIAELKENPKEIPDQSKAIKSLNEVGDAGSSLSIANSALPVFTTLAGLFKGSGNKLSIPYTKIDYNTQHDAWVSDDGNPNKSIWGDKIKKLMKSIDFKASIPQLVSDYLEFNKINNCDFIKYELTKVAVEYANGWAMKINFNDEENLKEDLENLKSLLAKINTSANYLYKSYGLKPIYNDIVAKRNDLSVWNDILQFPQILPPKEFKKEADETPAYTNTYKPFDEEEGAKRKAFELTIVNDKKEVLLSKKDYYKTAPTHWVTGSVGLVYLFNSYRTNEDVLNNGAVTKLDNENQLRLIAGLNFYPKPIILADDRCIFSTGKDWISRLSLFAGLSFPKPLYNLHTGLSLDIWTGVKLTGGVHFYRFTNYEVVNNVATKQESKYVSNGGFIGLTIEPLTFAKLIGLINLK